MQWYHLLHAQHGAAVVVSTKYIVKATTLVFAVQGIIAVIATQAMCNLS